MLLCYFLFMPTDMQHFYLFIFTQSIGYLHVAFIRLVAFKISRHIFHLLSFSLAS